ncbi:MAG: 50S ribosomal protein L13 [Nanoarchaeota archaeon]|nr:50S ribosomal protein L13 [Nanoarchaeota archaeon]
MSEEVIINGENAVLGRLASYCAKESLKGKKIIIVNSDKVIITGNMKNIIEKYNQRRARGGSAQKGPNFPSTPERILKRTIKGMIPNKKGRGREIFKEIRCYNEIPEEFKNKKMIKSGKGNTGISLRKISSMLKGGTESTGNF